MRVLLLYYTYSACQHNHIYEDHFFSCSFLFASFYDIFINSGFTSMCSPTATLSYFIAPSILAHIWHPANRTPYVVQITRYELLDIHSAIWTKNNHLIYRGITHWEKYMTFICLLISMDCPLRRLRAKRKNFITRLQSDCRLLLWRKLCLMPLPHDKIRHILGLHDFWWGVYKQTRCFFFDF